MVVDWSQLTHKRALWTAIKRSADGWPRTEESCNRAHSITYCTISDHLTTSRIIVGGCEEGRLLVRLCSPHLGHTVKPHEHADKVDTVACRRSSMVREFPLLYDDMRLCDGNSRESVSRFLRLSCMTTTCFPPAMCIKKL